MQTSLNLVCNLELRDLKFSDTSHDFEYDGDRTLMNKDVDDLKIMRENRSL